MHDAVADEFGVFQAGDHGKDPFLFGELEVRLEADDIVQRSTAVILAQLDDSIRQFTRTGQFQADRLHRAIAHGVDTTASHDFDRHTAFKDTVVLFKFVEFGTFSRRQGLPEGFIFFFGKGAVQIVCPALAVTGRAVDLGHVQGVDGDDRRCGIVEMEIVFPRQAADGIGQGVTGQRAAGDDADLVIRQFRHFFMTDSDQRMILEFFRHILAERDAVDGQSAASRDAVRIGCVHDERAQTTHFFLQEADGVFDIGCPQGVAADEFSKIFCMVCRRRFDRPHFDEFYWNAAADELPGSFRTGQTGTDD